MCKSLSLIIFRLSEVSSLSCDRVVDKLTITAYFLVQYYDSIVLCDYHEYIKILLFKRVRYLR